MSSGGRRYSEIFSPDPKDLEYDPQTGRYRCLVCIKAGKTYCLWMKKSSLREHYRSWKHRDAVKQLNPEAASEIVGVGEAGTTEAHVLKQDLEAAPAPVEMALYYPTTSPDEPVHCGVRVAYAGPGHVRVKDVETGEICAVQVAVICEPNDVVYCCTWCQQLETNWRLRECDRSFTFTQCHIDVPVESLNQAVFIPVVAPELYSSEGRRRGRQHPRICATK